MPITNWDWSLVEGEEQAAGVTWGDYHVVGTYDGASFTVLESGPPEVSSPGGGDRFETPCPEPQEGWVATDPAKATEDDLQATVSLAAGFADSSGSWITILRQPPGEDSFGPDDVVLNLAFTGDPEEHRQQVEEVWGGPLCMIEHRQHSQAELLAIQRELSDRAQDFDIELLYSWTDVVKERVVAGVVLASAASQAAIDALFGPGIVVMESALQPLG
jgi:hypothetical protein